VNDSKEFGRHFCSEVHTVEVTASTTSAAAATAAADVIYHLVVKSQPQDADARQLLQPGQTFEKEVCNKSL